MGSALTSPASCYYLLADCLDDGVGVVRYPPGLEELSLLEGTLSALDGYVSAKHHPTWRFTLLLREKEQPMRTGMLLATLLLAVACQDIAQPPAEGADDKESPRIGGVIAASFYFDAEAAARTLQVTERLLADEAWIGRQAAIRDITADSVRRELTADMAHTEQYLEKKASAQGMTGPEYRRVVEGRMRRVWSPVGYEKLLPSRPFDAQTSGTAAVGGATGLAREQRPGA